MTRRIALLRHSLAQSIRSQIDLGEAALSQPGALARLETCLTDCPDLGHDCCRLIPGGCGVAYAAWVRQIVAGTCPRWL